MSRTVIVGDVHGCADELAELLDRIGLSATDRLVMVGDLVMRGPEPLRVIDLVRQAGGTSVRGNHEDRLLRHRRARRREAGQVRDDLENGEEGDATDRRVLASSELSALATALDEEAWDFIAAMPLSLELPRHELLVVHAGILPGRPLSATPERALLYLRNLRDDGTPSERRDDGRPWGMFYQGPPHVCFGHNAQAEPQLHRFATGLDTGCVYGGTLTALVLASGEPVPASEAARRAALVAVPARRVYVPIGR
jgi:hypothetical protein